MDKAKITEQLQNAASLSMELAEEQTAGLFLLLQSGFIVSACIGCSIQDFFHEQLGLSPEYVQEKIQGIFLDGKPADEIETAIIRDGSRLTLSGTMPGLVGIALRRGPLAVFRLGITHRETGDNCHGGDGFVQLKLLNLLMKDLGPELLRKGIYINASELAGYFNNLPPGFWQKCRKIVLDGAQIGPEMLQKGAWIPTSGMVKFSVVPS